MVQPLHRDRPLLTTSQANAGLTGVTVSPLGSVGNNDFGHPSFDVFANQITPVDWTWQLTATYIMSGDPVPLPPLTISVADISADTSLVITEATASQYGLDWQLLGDYLFVMDEPPRIPLESHARMNITHHVDSNCTICTSTISNILANNSEWRFPRVLEPEYVEVRLAIVTHGPFTNAKAKGRVSGIVQVFGPATVPEPSAGLLVIMGLCFATYHTPNFRRK